MPRAGAAIAFALALPGLAAANTVIFNVVPNADPDSAIYCALSLNQGRLVALQAKGVGLQNPRAVAWWANEADTTAFLRGVQALVSGAVPSENPNSAPWLDPPFLTVTWIANLNGQVTSGRYVTHELRLPDELSQMLATVMPGGYCAP